MLKEMRRGYNEDGSRKVGRPYGSKTKRATTILSGINQVLPIKFLNPTCESFVKNNEIRFIEINGNKVFLHLKDSTVVAI